jgi:hypothetical protein
MFNVSRSSRIASLFISEADVEAPAVGEGDDGNVEVDVGA